MEDLSGCGRWMCGRCTVKLPKRQEWTWRNVNYRWFLRITHIPWKKNLAATAALLPFSFLGPAQDRTCLFCRSLDRNCIYNDNQQQWALLWCLFSKWQLEKNGIYKRTQARWAWTSRCPTHSQDGVFISKMLKIPALRLPSCVSWGGCLSSLFPHL